jgi:protein O-GlcNAc transferase
MIHGIGNGESDAHPTQALKRAIAAYNNRKFSEAELLCREIIKAKPDFFKALHLLAMVQTRLGRLNDALASYERALVIRPTDAEALNNCGLVLQKLRRFDEALASYDRALAFQPDLAQALRNRGNLLFFEQNRFEEALTSYNKVLAIKRDDVATLANRGRILYLLKRFEEALASYDEAIALKPDHADVLYNRAKVLRVLQRFQGALACYDQVLELQPQHAQALNARGNILRDLKRFAEALASYEQALAMRPDYTEAIINRGDTLRSLKRYEEALASYEQALAGWPDDVATLTNRGNTLRRLKRFDQAIASYERALAHEPDHKGALSGLAGCTLKICDWTRHDMLVRGICKQFSEQKSVITPFVLLSYSDDEALHLSCAKNHIRNRIAIPPKPLWRGERWHNDRVKVAYVRGRPMAYLMAELFELHDRSKFEVIGVSFAPDNRSELRPRLIAAFDEFHDVERMNDRDVARLLNDLRVDIAVDLQGHQQDARPGIFAFRPAPIQVNYLGYPGTTGADFIDYIIADPIVLPLHRQSCYTEKIVHLPDCYQANDRKRADSARMPTREEVGLPAQGFVFCCFNNTWKITPAVFDVWMRLLRALDDSALWLLGDNEDAERNLRKEAASRSVDPARLIFAERIDSAHHLARHRLADLFLDTLPVNAHATASYALWAGVPVLTCQGKAFAGRVGASLLNAIGLSELVTHSLAEYEALALSLAREPELLGSYRDRLARNRLTYPLFDTDRFRRHIEAAYRLMWERWQQGKEPDSFEIAG